MSPALKPVYIAVGFVLALVITAFWRQELFPPGSSLRLHPRQVMRLFLYLASLVYNVILASVQVAVIVLSPQLPISPGFVVLKTKLKQDMTRVLYANSITLTPGTITIDLEGDRLLVHALTIKGAKDVCDWYMQDMLRRMESNEP